MKTAILRLATWPRDRARWRRVDRAGGPRVFYGFDCLPGPADRAGGGIVKVQDLRRAFPNHPRGANLLYLVSSARPLFAARMARMARRAGARLVVNQNGVAYPGWHGPGWERTNEEMRELAAAADHVIYQSAFCRESADRFLGPRDGPSSVLLNPVDTAVFTPAEGDPAPGALVLLLAGTHEAFYRVRSAIETLARLRAGRRDARLIVAGRCAWRPGAGAALDEAREAARALGVAGAVEFRGPYTQAEAPGLLRSAHVLLHTKYNDPCPRLVAEALAGGLPVVYSASGGVPEIVGPGAGVGVPAPRDYERDHPPAAEALAEAVRQVDARRAEFARAARARAVAALDVRPWIEAHRRIFEEALA
jgi:glycosyltransferase involved in cell wall biosynthesis